MCRMISPFWSSAINSLGTFIAGHCTQVRNLICTSRLILGKLVSFHFQPVYSLAFPMKFCTYIYWGERVWLMLEWVGRGNGPFVLYVFVTEYFLRIKILMVVTPFMSWFVCGENVYVWQHRVFLFLSGGFQEGPSENEDGVIDTACLSVIVYFFPWNFHISTPKKSTVWITKLSWFKMKGCCCIINNKQLKKIL